MNLMISSHPIRGAVHLFLWMLPCGSTMAFDASCAKTPELAIRASKSNVAESLPPQDTGYRVRSMRYDTVLNQQWAVVANCGHPERPTIALPVGSIRTNLLAATHDMNDARVAVVHAGEIVQAWQQGPTLRLEVAGRAEESGIIGSRIRIRVLHAGFESGQPLTVTGIVRGPRNVEILQ
jgi:hypothetical protein